MGAGGTAGQVAPHALGLLGDTAVAACPALGGWSGGDCILITNHFFSVLYRGHSLHEPLGIEGGRCCGAGKMCEGVQDWICSVRKFQLNEKGKLSIHLFFMDNTFLTLFSVLQHNATLNSMSWYNIWNIV